MHIMHLTEGMSRGFRKILEALRKNGSPLPEFETDETHDYFITRIFVRTGFYDFQNVPENVTENVVEALPNTSFPMPRSYTSG